MAPKEAEGSEAEDPKKLTPYQGKSRCFGLYQCPKCDRQWSSGNSWANTTQTCRGCGTKVYAKQQRRLWRKKLRNTDRSKAHPEELCGKCQQLGHSCVWFLNRENNTEENGKKKRSKKSKKKTETKMNSNQINGTKK